MPDFDKRHSYSQVLSAAICLCFSFSAPGQTSVVPPDVQTPVPPPPPALSRQQQSIAIQQQSVQRQRAAIRQQESAPSESTAPQPAATAPSYPGTAAAPGPFSPGCPPVSPMMLQGVVQRAATLYSVTPSLINAVIRQESAGYPCAVSDKGAMGLMQLMPDTAVQMGARDPFDITQNVMAGTRLLGELLQRYKGDLNRVLAAYNAGSAAVDKAGGTPPFPETLNYVRSVLDQINEPFDPKLFDGPVR
jgi:soluble lytic murein transglycosylase-like protein